MALPSQLEQFAQDDDFKAIALLEQSRDLKEEPILCPHCRRTASNGIKCKGICVADSDY